MSRVVLGKGLNALIPNESTRSEESDKFRIVELDRIAPNPMQPRREFDESSLRALAESLKANGVMQPLIVKQGESGYTIIAGERRFRAAKLAGLKEAPVVLMDDVDDTRMLELALIENLQREDLNPLDAAEAYRALMERCSCTQNELADKVGKSRAAIANQIRLLALPESIKMMIRDGRLAEGHARAILSLPTEEAMIVLANRIVGESMSVRAVEQVTSRTKKRRLIPKRLAPALADAEVRLKQLLGTSVKIKHGLKRGKIEIEYYGDEDLSRLMELMERIS